MGMDAWEIPRRPMTVEEAHAALAHVVVAVAARRLSEAVDRAAGKIPLGPDNAS
jgi:hypothetical protein